MFDSRLMPKFSILNPKFTMTVPENQMKAGIYDIMWNIPADGLTDGLFSGGLPKFYGCLFPK